MTTKKCFVISPIGQPGSAIRTHADDVLEFIIDPATKLFEEEFNIRIEPLRADHMHDLGGITKQMFDEILNADLCIAVLTGHNPNVFYELAVAQAAARPVIILIENGQTIPFDIRDLRSVFYALQPVSPLIEGVFAKQVFEYMKSIHAAGWSTPGLFELYGYGPQPRYERQLQSMLKTARPKPLPAGFDKVYALPSDPGRHIIFATGDIKQMKDLHVDSVVSLETIDLQLARYNDPGLSGTLRYLDAEKTSGGSVLKDSLHDQLQAKIREMGISLPLAPGSVVSTPTNQLQLLGIQYVFHVAALQGAIGDGYTTLEYLIDDCIRNVYSEFGELAKRDSGLHSIMFPMLGAATAELELNDLAERIVKLLVNGMERFPSCHTTYLLAWTESHLHAITKAATELGLVDISATELTNHPGTVADKIV